MRRISFLSFFLFLVVSFSIAQSVGIGTNNPSNAAILDIQSNSKGLLIPRLTSAQRKAIQNPESGLIVFDIDKRAVFLYEDNQWGQLSFKRTDVMEQMPITASDIASNDQFGFAVAMAGDYAVASSPTHDVDGNADQGSAYIYHKVNGVWKEVQQIVASDGATGDEFGTSIAMSGDYIAVGVPKSNNGGTDRGSVYIYHRTGNTWVQEVRIGASDGAAFDNFGKSLSYLGDQLLIGAPGDDIGSNADQGSAYIYQRSGIAWSLVKKLTASDGAADDEFGTSVGLSYQFAIVGSPKDDVSYADQGSAYIYWAPSLPAWAQVQKLVITDNNSTSFGYSVGIDDTENAFVSYGVSLVGSYSKLFKRGNFGIWTANPTSFGGASNIVIRDSIMSYGNPSFSSQFTASGSASVLKKNGNDWVGVKTFYDSTPSDFGYFGCSVGSSGYDVIIGIRGKSSNRGAIVFINYE